MLPVRALSTVSIAGTGVADTDEERRSRAMKWMRGWVNLQSRNRPNAAVVFDVDHTLVEPSRDNPVVQVPIPSVCEFYRHCHARSIQCFIVTARLDFEDGRKVLRALLRDIGAEGVRAMYLRPGAVRPTIPNLAEFKSQCRKDIEQRFGVSVVANIGDNWHDLIKPPFSDEHHALWDLDDRHSFVGVLEDGEAVVKLPGAARG